MAGELIDNAVLNNRFMEVIGVGDEHGDGGKVEFSVKELLVEQNQELRRIGEKIDQRPTRTDLDRVEREVKAEVLAVATRTTALEKAEVDNRIRWAKVIGAAAAIGTVGGGIGATVVNALGLGS